MTSLSIPIEDSIQAQLQTGFKQFQQVTSRSKRIDHNRLQSIVQNRFDSFVNPNTERFFEAYHQLPDVDNKTGIFDKAQVEIDYSITESIARSLIPWRKGPFKFDNFIIDSEWQSNLKWDRFRSFFPNLNQKRILDIGCGNGYYMFRMLANDPTFILGIDPSDLTYYQFHLIQHFLQDPRLHYLPISWNDLDPFDHYFDVVVCMGIMYHHRSPQDLLRTIRDVMKPDGVVMFDTLIIDGEDDVALFPKDRYAKMPNVYFIPTLSCLKNMFNRAGFKHIDILSIDATTSDEQRVTDWTFGKSLTDFLDPNDHSKTIEGYPAPKRIALLASIKTDV